MRSVGDLFALWPATADLGRELGVPYPTVASWKQRGSIPTEYWRDVVRAAQRRGHSEVTADVLVDLHARKPTSEVLSGFAEEDAMPIESEAQTPVIVRGHSNTSDTGHFSRWKHLQRHHFASGEAIAAHVRALREEWDRR